MIAALASAPPVFRAPNANRESRKPATEKGNEMEWWEQSRWRTQMIGRFRCSLAVLIVAVLSACASLPPGSDFPKTASSALAQPEETRLGRQFADAARKHGGNSAFRMLALGVDGFLTRAQMVNAAERTL